ncbi:MAG: type II toxin-antitoxin system HicA family toxin [Verrucomicrobiota bacterium]
MSSPSKDFPQERCVRRWNLLRHELADLQRHQRRHGSTFYREGGAPTVWLNGANRKIASVPRHREIKEGTVRAIGKQLEVPPP